MMMMPNNILAHHKVHMKRSKGSLIEETRGTQMWKRKNKRGERVEERVKLAWCFFPCNGGIRIAISRTDNRHSLSWYDVGVHRFLNPSRGFLWRREKRRKSCLNLFYPFRLQLFPFQNSLSLSHSWKILTIHQEFGTPDLRGCNWICDSARKVSPLRCLYPFYWQNGVVPIWLHSNSWL